MGDYLGMNLNDTRLKNIYHDGFSFFSCLPCHGVSWQAIGLPVGMIAPLLCADAFTRLLCED